MSKRFPQWLHFYCSFVAWLEIHIYTQTYKHTLSSNMSKSMSLEKNFMSYLQSKLIINPCKMFKIVSLPLHFLSSWEKVKTRMKKKIINVWSDSFIEYESNVSKFIILLQKGDIWMTGIKSLKLYYLKNKIFTDFYISVSWCIGERSKYVSWNISSWRCLIQYKNLFI